jgi:hypothetical protein
LLLASKKSQHFDTWEHVSVLETGTLHTNTPGTRAMIFKDFGGTKKTSTLVNEI